MHTFWKVHNIMYCTRIYILLAPGRTCTQQLHAPLAAHMLIIIIIIFHIRGGDPVNNILEIKFGKKTHLPGPLCAHIIPTVQVYQILSQKLKYMKVNKSGKRNAYDKLKRLQDHFRHQQHKSFIHCYSVIVSRASPSYAKRRRGWRARLIP